MADPITHVRAKLTDRIARIIDEHQPQAGDAGAGCSCGAQDHAAHSRHVANEIVHQLGLMPDSVDEVKKRIRYATAVLDWELTKLEGAEC